MENNLEILENISVEDFVKTLKPITDFNKLKKGDKIFNRCSLDINCVDIFDHLENWSENREIVVYINYKGDLCNGLAEDYWYYYENNRNINKNCREELCEGFICSKVDKCKSKRKDCDKHCLDYCNCNSCIFKYDKKTEQCV